VSRYIIDPEEWSFIRLQKHGSYWRISLLERELSSAQREHLRAAAFNRLREEEFIPRELIDLVEGYKESVPVQLLGRREAQGLRLIIKQAGKKTKPRDALPASEALAFVLRIMLRELKQAERKRDAPARTLKLLPRSVIGEVALDLLESCQLWRWPPGPFLCELLRELLNLDHHPEAAPNADIQEQIAFVVAQHPSIKTRELYRMFGINPGTISRWRRSSAFIQSVNAWTKVLRQMEAEGKWPPCRQG